MLLNLEFFNNLINNAKENEFVQNFINELSKFLENKLNISNQTTKYSEYWKYQNFMEDNVSSRIGLSRWANDVTYKEELSKAIDDSILELANKEGALFRKQFRANGSPNGNVYSIEKFENGSIERLRIPADKIPSKYKDEDIIFQYGKDGEIDVRLDLKEKIVNRASEKCAELKLKEDEKANEFKKEGHIYEAYESDGYIFLKDITEGGKGCLEDIDFVVDCFDGEGKYQVIDGEYRKL